MGYDLNDSLGKDDKLFQLDELVKQTFVTNTLPRLSCVNFLTHFLEIEHAVLEVK